MKILITIEAQDENNNRLAVETGCIHDVNNIGTGISQWVMESVIKAKMAAIFGEKEPEVTIPNMVKEMMVKFGHLQLSTLENEGPEPLGGVFGLRQVGTMVFVRRVKENSAGRPTIDETGDAFEEEIIQFPSVLLLITDQSGEDITLKVLEFAETLCGGTDA